MTKADITEQTYDTLSKRELFSLYEESVEELKVLKWQYEALRRLTYGKKSERFVNEPTSLQLPLPGFEYLFEPQPKKQEDLEEVKGYKRVKKNAKAPLVRHDGRFPDSLPREDAGVLPLAESEKLCPDCGTERVPFKEEICERLVHKRQVSLVVKQYRKQVCKCPHCQDSIAKPPSPPTPLKSVQLESSVYAHILSQKFEFGLPYYRVEEVLKQGGFGITRTTLCEYQGKLYELLKPLHTELMNDFKSGSYLHCDETAWKAKVTNAKTGQKTYRQCVAWVMVGEKGSVSMSFGLGKYKESFHQLVGAYHGFVVCDGEDHYDFHRFASESKLARCNAHSRRKWEQAKKDDRARATYALRIYHLVYRREAYIRRLDNPSAEKVLRLRQVSAKLLLHLKGLSLQITRECLPKSPIGKAARYFIAFYDDLVRFCSEACLPVDNNLNERLIRSFVIGRKAWLFSSSEDGAKSSALFYSLVLTCMHNGISVTEYLEDIIERLGVKGETDYASLLPVAWQATRCKVQGNTS